METTDWLQIGLLFVLIISFSPFLGEYFFRALNGNDHPIRNCLAPLERFIFRISKVNPTDDMDWKRYTINLLVFNFLGLLVVFLLQELQNYLPLNPQGLPNVEPLLALNTAISFVTNTNWQAYSGESTLSYLTQMLGLGVQNFLSAATGICVLLALARGLTRTKSNGIGNFWVDLVRGTLYVLLPCSLLMGCLLVSQGVVQSFAPYVSAKTLEGAQQLIPMGPAASQIAIKQLGTNGGGFFGVNSAHPFENPTPLSNFLEMFAILLIPASLVWTFGRFIKRPKHVSALFWTMLILLVATSAAALWANSMSNPAISGRPFLEGVEQRFGIEMGALWGTFTSATSNGSVNAMHDSFAPLAGGVVLFNMLLGEIVFGGVGSGLYGMVLLVIVTVFLAGLMVGRSPEYLGKRIESREIILSAVGVLLPGVVVLIFTAAACLTPAATASVLNPGPHGLSEILYAFASPANNNGSAFAGLNANTVFYNVLTAAAMLLGRFGVIIPVLALAGGLGQKKTLPETAGTFPIDGPVFVILLLSVIIVVTALTFFPVLSLGPLVEHFLMLKGVTF